MAHVLIMPRQGNTVESCVIIRWKAAEGASVAADETVCEVETDKASFDVPAGAAGTLLKILRPEGDDVPVLEPIAVIGSKGEDWSAALGRDAAAGREDAALTAVPVAAAPAAAASSNASVGVSPRARKLAESRAVDAALLVGSGPGGRVIERDVRSALAGRPELTAAAKAMVAAGAALPAAGSALGGRAGLADLATAKSAPAAPRPVAAGEFPGPFSETPLKGIRKIISERMLGSLASTAQLTFNGSANAARILELRARFKSSNPTLGLSEITIGDLVLFAVTRVLSGFPNANAHLAAGTLRIFDRIHLSLAVDTPRGLMVPVIRNADLLSLKAISAESKRLASACQSGNISPDELAGGTFTVSNLGAFGIESFTPVLNAPQVAILGVDTIVQRPVAGPGGTIALEPRMGLSLTVDHQIIDGAPAARILKAFADAIADIDLLLAE